MSFPKSIYPSLIAFVFGLALFIIPARPTQAQDAPDCAGTSGHVEQCNTLVAFYISTNGANWKDKTNCVIVTLCCGFIRAASTARMGHLPLRYTVQTRPIWLDYALREQGCLSLRCGLYRAVLSTLYNTSTPTDGVPNFVQHIPAL